MRRSELRSRIRVAHDYSGFTRMGLRGPVKGVLEERFSKLWAEGLDREGSLRVKSAARTLAVEGGCLNKGIVSPVMATRLYVGNLPYSVTSEELRELFSRYGTVTDVHVVMDRETGRPRGFAFVSLETPEMAQAAVDALNQHRMGGRPLAVNVARERGAPAPPRPGGGAGSRPPRPGGPPPGGGSGFRRPTPPMMPPEEEPQKEIRRRERKKKGRGGDVSRDRVGQSRQQILEEREVSRGTGASWRQWLEDDEGDLSDLKSPWEEEPEADAGEEGGADEDGSGKDGGSAEND